VQAGALLKRLFLSLLLPVGLALLADWLLGTLPWITLVVGLICIPLASLVVIKAALRDFNRVIAAVAPEVDEAEAQAVPEAEAGQMPGPEADGESGENLPRRAADEALPVAKGEVASIDEPRGRLGSR
jgi:hypothetical protein